MRVEGLVRRGGVGRRDGVEDDRRVAFESLCVCFLDSFSSTALNKVTSMNWFRATRA